RWSIPTRYDQALSGAIRRPLARSPTASARFRTSPFPQIEPPARFGRYRLSRIEWGELVVLVDPGRDPPRIVLAEESPAILGRRAVQDDERGGFGLFQLRQDGFLIAVPEITRDVQLVADGITACRKEVEHFPFGENDEPLVRSDPPPDGPGEKHESLDGFGPRREHSLSARQRHAAISAV